VLVGTDRRTEFFEDLKRMLELAFDARRISYMVVKSVVAELDVEIPESICRDFFDCQVNIRCTKPIGVAF
jgi:hypothetical protein